MRFEVDHNGKKLIFDSELHGIIAHGVEYLSGRNGVLIYDKVKDIQADELELQLSTNTSTLIPALRILGIPYHPYFDERPVVDSQNNITFYWNPSKLAAFYNQFSTDELDHEDREPVIRDAINFIAQHVDELPLPESYLMRMQEPCKLLGFYQGFPIFDNSVGFAKLQSRLGIHVGSEDMMISTPLDQYEADVYQLADQISKEIGLDYSKKKNRVVFEITPELLNLLKITL